MKISQWKIPRIERKTCQNDFLFRLGRMQTHAAAAYTHTQYYKNEKGKPGRIYPRVPRFTDDFEFQVQEHNYNSFAI